MHPDFNGPTLETQSTMPFDEYLMRIKEATKRIDKQTANFQHSGELSCNPSMEKSRPPRCEFEGALDSLARALESLSSRICM